MIRICNKKTLIAAVLLVSAFLVTGIGAMAAEGQRIGNFTTDETVSGESKAGSDKEDSGVSTGITLSDGVIYKPSTGRFYHTVENSSFSISIPNDAIVTEAVSVQAPSALTTVLYRNGIALEGVDYSNISAPGKYVLSVSSNGSAQAERVTFTIVSSPTGMIKEYKMPADFYIVSVTRNGEERGFSQSRADLSKDGDYVIEYCAPELDLDLRLEVTIDHTAPTVTLTGLTNGKSNGTVTVNGLEEGAKAYVIRNNQAEEYTGSFSATGSYTLTVQDVAGNESVYDFVIVAAPTVNRYLIIVAVSVAAAVLLIYLLYYRKKVRVS